MKLKQELNIIKKECLIQNDIENYIRFINFEMNNNKSNIYEYLKDIKKLIELGYLDDANELLEKVKNINYSKSNNSIINYLKKLIIEYKNMNNGINKYLGLAKEHYMNDRLEVALDLYISSKKITNNNIFNYYIGKMYFKLKKYKESEYYLKEYSKNGAIKLSKSKFYLCSIYIKRHKYQKCVRIIDEIEKINSFEESKGVNLDRIKNFVYNAIDGTLKNYSNINMSEEDFKSKKLVIDNKTED